jgi:hypothetical protein
MKDWSIDIEGKTVTDSMYDQDVGPAATDVAPEPLPVIFYPQPAGAEWAPFQVQADAGDALFPSEYSFDLAQNYITLADGTALATLTAKGLLPVNQFIEGAGAPVITDGSLVLSTTGGSIPGGQTLRISVCALDADGHSTPPSLIVLTPIPAGTNTNAITISGIQWPAIAGLATYEVFVSDRDDLICRQQTGSLTEAAGHVYSPTSITIDGPFQRSTIGLPNQKIKLVRLKAKHLVHGGVLGAAVDSASGTSIISVETVDVALTDDWSGRVLAQIGRDGGSAPLDAYNITAFDPATGEFTVDRTVADVQPGDAFVVCFKGYDNSANPLAIEDAGISNASNPTPHTGETPHDPNRKGNIVRVIRGTGRGQKAKIVDNSATGYTLDARVRIDVDSVWIVESPAWEYSVDSSPVNNADLMNPTSIGMPTDNFLGQAMLVGGFTVDSDDVESEDGDAVVRMVYLFGSRGTIDNPGVTMNSIPVIY